MFGRGGLSWGIFVVVVKWGDFTGRSIYSFMSPRVGLVQRSFLWIVMARKTKVEANSLWKPTDAIFRSSSMAKLLVFQLGESQFSFDMNKVDRAKLYGSKHIEALDESNQKCELATLAGDGCTLIGRGGTGLGWLDADGSWREKSELKPVDNEGNEIEPVKSSFGAPIKLFDTATTEEYLEANIRLVYAMDFKQSETQADVEELLSELNRGTIFKFPYSYRGGLEADVAFLLNNEADEVMMVVGTQTQIEFIGLAAPSGGVDETGATEETGGGLMDFDMI
jgi:hypothetical protein